MTVPIKQSSFAGGEISPLMFGQTDQVKYANGLRTMRNKIAMRHGGSTRRPGTQYIGTTLNGGAAVRLIPFIFNETGNGQSYVLEFGNLYIAFIQNGGYVTSGGVPYTIVSPYAQADLANLKFVETGDVVTIVHPSYAPRELSRVAATNWTLSTITFGPRIASPTILVINTGGAGVWSGVYAVTGVTSSGEESDPTYYPILNVLPPTTTPHIITLLPLDGASSYRIYLQDTNNTSHVVGLIVTMPNTQIQFINPGITPDYSNNPPIPNILFNSPGNYPSAVGFVQQRRCFANTNNNPVGFWMSQPGAFSNFEVHSVVVDSDTVFGSIAGVEINSIQHIVELKAMLMLTAGAELYVQGNGNGVVTPSSINASVQSQYGASPLRPLKIADTAIFNQALGNSIRDLTFDFVISGYRGNDITVFSSHLFEGYSVVDWDYQKVPDSIIWVVRNDGTLLACTYFREQQLNAWHRHDFTNGTVENVCCIPENGQYAVYLSIKRVINGSTVRYIERMSSRIWSDVLNATYLDCFSSFNGTNMGSTTMTLLTPAAGFTQDTTAYQQQITLQASASFFTVGMVGNQIFLSDANFVLNRGNTVDPENDGSSFALSAAGNQIRCTIISYISATQVVVTPNRAVPATLQNTAVLTWARAVQTVTGLGYLIGQQVSVWADRTVVGSPLNTDLKTVYTVALDGSLTLDKCYSVIYVGLPMVSDFETLDLENAFGESSIAKRKRSSKIALYLYQTRNLMGGSENPDSNPANVNNDPLFQLYELKSGINRLTYDEPPELMTEQNTVAIDSRWNKNGRIFVRNVDPTPQTILAVSPGGDSTPDAPFYKKV